MVFIYVIKLEKGKYYIGKTNNPYFRLENHFKKVGSKWTKIYKPLKVIEIRPDCDDYDEDKITIQYMNKYGINNVRGGSFVSVELDKSTIELLKKMINGSNNNCFNCGKKGHFANECKKNKKYGNKYKEYYDIWECEYCEKEFIDKIKCEYHEEYCKLKNTKYNYFDNIDEYYNSDSEDSDDLYDSNKSDKCNRCGRKGHNISSCYASKHIKGYYLKHN